MHKQGMLVYFSIKVVYLYMKHKAHVQRSEGHIMIHIDIQEVTDTISHCLHIWHPFLWNALTAILKTFLCVFPSPSCLQRQPYRVRARRDAAPANRLIVVSQIFVSSPPPDLYTIRWQLLLLPSQLRGVVALPCRHSKQLTMLACQPTLEAFPLSVGGYVEQNMCCTRQLLKTTARHFPAFSPCPIS